MLRYIIYSGWSGLVISFLTILFFIGGLLIIGLERSRKGLALFALVSLLPLALGLVGAAQGCAHARGLGVKPGDPSYEVYLQNYAEAKYPAYVGAAATLILLSMTAVGALVTKKEQRPVGGGTKATLITFTSLAVLPVVLVSGILTAQSIRNKSCCPRVTVGDWEFEDGETNIKVTILPNRYVQYSKNNNGSGAYGPASRFFSNKAGHIRLSYDRGNDQLIIHSGDKTFELSREDGGAN